jgi:hypothetical protein
MENFFNWMSQPIPKDEVIVWFNIHNMSYEKIELYGDIFKSLYQIINNTYLGSDNSETKIFLSDEDNQNHFEWCWKTILDLFKKENIHLKPDGQLKNYFKSFFSETFYEPNQKNIKLAIPNFLDDVFCLDTPFTKSDLDLLTEVYNLLEKNME